MLRETVEFSLSADAYEAKFPNAFTLANPRPMFSMEGKTYVLQSASWDGGNAPVKCKAMEEPDAIYAWAGTHF